jgi:hypothetical protein
MPTDACQYFYECTSCKAFLKPPDPGTVPITGPNLADTYQHYFGTKFPDPPLQMTDPYEISNWRDCKMTAALWT